MNKESIAALVILYNYNYEVIENIKSYSGSVSKVYVFDNSDMKVDQNLYLELIKIQNLLYFTENENKGLAYPINFIAEKAKKEDIKWLITFDQDSYLEQDAIIKMITFINEKIKIESTGLIGPLINDGKTTFSTPNTPYVYSDKIIQSGAWHNLDVLFKIKGYDENLFIDQVDLEYCARILSNHYKIIKINTVVLKHNVSDTNSSVKYIKGKRFTINKYRPIRYYYIVRNNLYCYFKYKHINRIYAEECKRNLEVIIKTILYEEEKIKKISAVLMAITDFLLKRMGKCQWNI